MTDERRRELWQMKLNAMPDDMIESEYRRRLARRRWSKRETPEPAAANSRQAASSPEPIDALAFFERIIKRGNASKHPDT